MDNSNISQISPTKKKKQESKEFSKDISSNKMIKETNFFEEIFGFPESIENVHEFIIPEKVEGRIILKDIAKEEIFNCGKFCTKAIKDFNLLTKKEKGKFNLIIGQGISTEKFKEIDIGALQSNPQNRGATFQVASNFNCLEFINSRDSASSGISKYIFDRTQGPAASISTAPATLYRNYFVLHQPENEKQEYLGQLEKQINLLERFPFIPVKNGYISFTAKSLKELRQNDFNFSIDDIKIGMHNGIQVTSGLKQAGQIELCNDKNQVVNQVFTAALNMCDLPFSQEEWVNNLSKQVACWLLRAAYRGTILAGIENSITQDDNFPGKNKLFLTLIGGGVFANDLDWIIKSILECEDLIANSGLEVNLVIFDQATFPKEKQKSLQDLVKKTKGRIQLVK